MMLAVTYGLEGAVSSMVRDNASAAEKSTECVLRWRRIPHLVRDELGDGITGEIMKLSGVESKAGVRGVLETALPVLVSEHAYVLPCIAHSVSLTGWVAHETGSLGLPREARAP